MAENKMEEVAKILGLELEEEFNITSNGLIYKITDSGVYFKYDNDVWYDSQILSGLIEGRFEVVKKPWKPKLFDDYFAIEGNINCGVSICGYIWRNKITDIALYSMGNCFKTIEEAEKHKEEIINKTKDIIGRC